MAPVRMTILALLAGAFLFSACTNKRPVVEEFESWWRGLSSEEQETFLRDERGNPEIYKIDLTDEGKAIPELKEFADWVNKLRPAMIEAFELSRIEKATNDPRITDPLKQAEIIRVQPCMGVLVLSKHCGPLDSKVTETECLRCVPGLAKEKDHAEGIRGGASGAGIDRVRGSAPGPVPVR